MAQRWERCAGRSAMLWVAEAVNAHDPPSHADGGTISGWETSGIPGLTVTFGPGVTSVTAEH